MLPSLRLVALAALFTLPYAATAATVADSPSMLDTCTACPRIYTAMVKCQKIKRPGGIGSEIKNCICVPNPDGWYGYLLKCRDCLTGSNTFYNNLAGMMTQLLTSCTEAGGNVISNGESICASNAMWQECASLKDGANGELSWASFERFSDPSQNSNATQILSLAQAAGGSSSSATSGGGTSTTVAASASTAAASTGNEATGSEATTSVGTGSSTASQQSTATTASPSSTASSSAGELSYRPRAAVVLGGLAAAGVVGLVL
jgi:hypothetical protein